MTTGEMHKHRMRALLAECSEAQRGQISAEKSKRVAQRGGAQAGGYPPTCVASAFIALPSAAACTAVTL